MKYLSVCSGIEAATVAWHPLGWTPFAFAEIEKFPSAVLAHHYPHVPNLGDMTKFKDWPDAKIDLLVGGTPCQSFSVAGLRKGLDDPRGNLALTYCAILDKYRPEWFVWENVPGVLSSDGGRAFGSILGAMAELGYGFAYRVLDAQYVRVDGFGRAVPQRRRRVFVVGNSRDWRRAAAVLFERESLQGNTAPRREAGKGFAADIAPSIVSSGRGVERAGDTRGQDPVIAICMGSDPIFSHDVAMPSTTRNGDPGVVAFSCKDYGADAGSIAPTLRSMGHDGSHANAGGQLAVAFGIRSDASRDGEAKTPSADAEGRVRLRNPGLGIYSEIAPTMDAGVPHSVAFLHANKGRPDGRQSKHTEMVTVETETVPTLTTDGHAQSAVAFTQNQCGDVLTGDVMHSLQTNSDATGRSAPNVMTNWAVRRLTPKECERLQAFKDDYTLVPFRGKPAADGPRYKALGNSMAVNAMRWIGTRIEMVDRTPVRPVLDLRALRREMELASAIRGLQSRLSTGGVAPPSGALVSGVLHV